MRVLNPGRLSAWGRGTLQRASDVGCQRFLWLAYNFYPVVGCRECGNERAGERGRYLLPIHSGAPSPGSSSTTILQTSYGSVTSRKHRGTFGDHAEAIDEALCFGWIDGIRKSIDAKRFVNRFTPRRRRSNWSQMNITRVGELIELGGMTQPASKLLKVAMAKVRHRTRLRIVG